MTRSRFKKRTGSLRPPLPRQGQTATPTADGVTPGRSSPGRGLGALSSPNGAKLTATPGGTNTRINSKWKRKGSPDSPTPCPEGRFCVHLNCECDNGAEGAKPCRPKAAAVSSVGEKKPAQKFAPARKSGRKVSSVVQKAFSAFYPGEMARFDATTLEDGSVLLFSSHQASVKLLRSFCRVVANLLLPGAAEMITHCQTRYPLAQGFFMTVDGADVLVFRNGLHTEATPLELVVQDLRERQKISVTIPCGKQNFAHITALSRHPKPLVDLFECPSDLNVSLCDNGVEVNGFVKPDIHKDGVAKVINWIREHGRLSDLIGPLLPQQAVWFQQCSDDYLHCLRAIYGVEITYHAPAMIVLLQGDPEEVKSAHAELKQILDRIELMPVPIPADCPATVKPPLYLTAYEPFLERYPEVCLFYNDDGLGLVGDSADAHFAEATDLISSLDLKVETTAISPVLVPLRADNYAMCQQLEKEYNVSLRVISHSMQVFGISSDRKDLLQCVQDKLKRVTEYVYIPRLVAQHLRASDCALVSDILLEYPGVRVTGALRYPRQDKSKGNQFYYRLESALRDPVEAAAQHLRNKFDAMEKDYTSTTLHLSPGQMGILDLEARQVNRLANAQGIWIQQGAPTSPDVLGTLMYRRSFYGHAIELVRGDVADQPVDALVCPSNISPVGGTHPVGSCWKDSAGDLKTTKAILNAVEPHWLADGDLSASTIQLVQCVEAIISEAIACDAKSIAMPLISCNVSGQHGTSHESDIIEVILSTLQKQFADPRTTVQLIRLVEPDETRSALLLSKTTDMFGAPPPVGHTPVTIFCVPPRAGNDLGAQLMVLVLQHTFRDPLTVESNDKVLPSDTVLQRIAQKHRVDLQQDSASQCILKGHKHFVQSARRAIMASLVKIVPRPEEWTETDGRVELSSNTQEWNQVETLFRKNFPTGQICKIERIQLEELYKAYHEELDSLRARSTDEPKCLQLFHGTLEPSPDIILKQPDGVAKYCKTNGRWGLGTYFTESSSYCHDSAFRLVDRTTRQMFLMDVIVGNSVRLSNPDYALEESPKLEDGEDPDSVNAHYERNQVYITYKDHRQYPKYLITYGNK